MKGRSTTLVYWTCFELIGYSLSSKYSKISNCQGVYTSGLKAFCWVFGGLVPIYAVVSLCLKELTKLLRNVLGIWTGCACTAEHCSRQDAFCRRRLILKTLVSFRLQVIFISSFNEYVRKLQNTVECISLCWQQFCGQEKRKAGKALWA